MRAKLDLNHSACHCCELASEQGKVPGMSNKQSMLRSCTDAGPEEASLEGVKVLYTVEVGPWLCNIAKG